MASIQEKSRDETGEPSTSNGNREELQIPQRPCPKSQRKIIPTEKARKMHSDIKIPKESEIPKDCEICETTILKKNWTVHWNACQKYSGLIKKLQCVPCNKNYASRPTLLTHVRRSHANLILKVS